jgi:hypothetical protein
MEIPKERDLLVTMGLVKKNLSRYRHAGDRGRGI